MMPNDAQMYATYNCKLQDNQQDYNSKKINCNLLITNLNIYFI